MTVLGELHCVPFTFCLPFSPSLGVFVHVPPATNIVHSMAVSLPMQFFKNLPVFRSRSMWLHIRLHVLNHVISLTWWVPFPLSHNAEHSSNYFIFSSLSSQTPPYSVPLGIAATAGHTQCVERLLKGGAHINYQRQVCNNIIMT